MASIEIKPKKARKFKAGQEARLESSDSPVNTRQAATDFPFILEADDGLPKLGGDDE